MKEKNIGINLLRIYAVLSVVILHFLGHGGVLANTLINSSQYKLSWLLEIMAYPAVNIFGLISGYVYYNNGKVKKVFFSCFKLWVSIVFYCLIITLLFDIFSSIDIKPIDYLKALFPIANRPYWYFTAYFGLSIFMPIISKGLESIDDNKSRKLFMLIIIVFSFYDRIPNVMGMEYGYCVAWLLVLFILGALIKKCNIGYKMNNYVIAISIICLFIITYIYKIYGYEFKIFDYSITKDLLVNYTSPTILLSSVLLVILFLRIKVNVFFNKIITFFSTSAFFAYIINDNPLVRLNIINNSMMSLSTQSSLKIYVVVILSSLLFVLLTTLIDKIRLFAFEKLGINHLVNKASSLFEKISDYY